MQEGISAPGVGAGVRGTRKVEAGKVYVCLLDTLRAPLLSQGHGFSAASLRRIPAPCMPLTCLLHCPQASAPQRAPIGDAGGRAQHEAPLPLLIDCSH